MHYWGRLTLLLLLYITYLSLHPPADIPITPDIPGLDKVKHALAYGCCALPIAWYRPKGRLTLLMVIFAYSALLETLQPWFLRTFDTMDLLANGAGIVLALLLSHIGIKQHRHKP